MVHFCMHVTREIEEIVIGLFEATPLQGPQQASCWTNSESYIFQSSREIRAVSLETLKGVKPLNG